MGQRNVQRNDGLDEVGFAGDVEAASDRRRPWDRRRNDVASRQRGRPHAQTMDRTEAQTGGHHHVDRRVVFDDLQQTTQTQRATAADHRAGWKKQCCRFNAHPVVDRLVGIDVDVSEQPHVGPAAQLVSCKESVSNRLAPTEDPVPQRRRGHRRTG